jgi:glycosyltransferase involved in cell wall biosynthesis
MSPEPQEKKSSSTRMPLVRRSWFKRLRYALIPASSRQEHELWMMVKSTRERRYVVALISAVKLVFYILFSPLRRWFEPVGPFAGEPYFQDISRVVLYTQDSNLFPDYQPRRSLRSNLVNRIPVSLITTLRNEKDTVLSWLESLAGQTRPPDEVVIVDGGSTDGTLQMLEEFARQYSLPLKLISEPGANVARGRNIAITHASHDVIASTDLGCRLDRSWLERITYPFEDDPDMQVVGGWSDSVKTSKIKMLLLGIRLADVNPQSFMPSSRSIAFTKAAWEKVGGYPEWIKITGEDTFFDIELKKACRHWAFVPEAVVWWQAPDRISTYWRKLRHWSTGDGEALSGASLYWHSLTRLISLVISVLLLLVVLGWAIFETWISTWSAAVIFLIGSYLLAILSFSANVAGPRDLVSELGAELARVQGFLIGARRRPVSLALRYQGVKGFFFILAGVPIDDTGGGARCTQIALELLRQGYGVFYINRFPKYESVELDLIIYHPQLYATPLSYLRWKAFWRNYMGLFAGRPVGTLVEFPLREFLPIIKEIRRSGGVVAYDLLDDWDSSLGGNWYSLATEKEIISTSQLLIATETSLAERLEKLSQWPVSLIPNAVNSLLFDPQERYSRPDDFPEGTWSIIYVGSLWGEWFDWNLLTGIARQYPQAALLVIGDYHDQCADPPPNLHFFGLKPQRSLPAYLAHSSVAIIPWIVSPITQATSPLKVYEYIAMGKPVVAPNLRPLQGLPGVTLADNPADFITKVGLARGMDVPLAEMAAFTAQNNWQARVGKLLDLVEAHPQSGHRHAP